MHKGMVRALKDMALIARFNVLFSRAKPKAKRLGWNT
jgi:hypothetical protein